VKRAVPIILALVLSGAPAASPALQAEVVFSTENNASCDIGPYPAATLLLPYFEVDFNAPVTTALNTTFTLVNTSKVPQIARATIWTDMGYPVVWFNMFLTGYDAQSISLYEVVARGRLPMTSAGSQSGRASSANSSNPYIMQNTLCDSITSSIPAPLLQKVQLALTTGVRETGECPIGTAHKHAIGYLTIDVVNSCSAESPLESKYWTDVLLYDNVLTGEYIRINPDPNSGNYAGANPMVHIRAIPEGGPATTAVTTPFPYTFYDRYTAGGTRKSDRRQPLPSVFALRYIEGGATSFLTNYAVWREGVIGASKNPCDYAANARLALPHANVVRFDEHENATGTSNDAMTPSTALLPSNATIFPPASVAGDHGGWFWISLDNGGMKRPSQNWVIVQMYAEGRYGVDFDAAFLANGCTVTPPSAPPPVP
jgi:hypothetical protein